MVDVPRLIVPIAVLEGEVVPEALVEFLSTVPVVVLGYHEIPEQTLTDQARDEFEERAEAELADVVEAFESYDATVEGELAFTRDPARTIRRVVEDVDRGIVLRSNPVQSIGSVLVAVRDADLVPTISATVAALLGPTDASLTLLCTTTEAGDDASAEQLLSGMTTTLDEAGIEADRVTARAETADDPETIIVDASTEHDLIVLGEDDPSILEWLFASTTERVAEQTLRPVLVVQRPFED